MAPNADAVQALLLSGAVYPTVVEEDDRVCALAYGYRTDRWRDSRVWMALVVDVEAGTPHHARLAVAEWARVVRDRSPMCRAYFETTPDVLESLGAVTSRHFKPTATTKLGIRVNGEWIPVVFGSIDLGGLCSLGNALSDMNAPATRPTSPSALVRWLERELAIDLGSPHVSGETELRDIGIDSLLLAELMVAIEETPGGQNESADGAPRTVSDLLALWP